MNGWDKLLTIITMLLNLLKIIIIVRLYKELWSMPQLTFHLNKMIEG